MTKSNALTVTREIGQVIRTLNIYKITCQSRFSDLPRASQYNNSKLRKELPDLIEKFLSKNHQRNISLTLKFLHVMTEFQVK